MGDRSEYHSNVRRQIANSEFIVIWTNIVSGGVVRYFKFDIEKNEPRRRYDQNYKNR